MSRRLNIHYRKKIKIKPHSTSQETTTPTHSSEDTQNEMTLRRLVHLIKYPCRHLAKYVLKILSSVTVTTNSFVEKTQNNLYISLKIRK